jgi:hypothetical protein
MTEELLQSDIDMARSMISIGCGDAEIIESLRYRRITSDRAGRLIQELRDGRVVEPDRNSTPIAVRTSPEPTASRPVSDGRRSNSSRAGRHSRGINWFPILATCAVLLCLGAVAFLKHRRNSHQESPSVANVMSNSLPGHEAGSLRENPAALEIKIKPEGVWIGGIPVAGKRVTGGLFPILGTPSRTNHLGDADSLVYAFDDHGLLIYAGRDPAKDSIVIDFEGTGGTNGAVKPFPGTLKILDSFVTAATDPASLSSIEGVQAGTENSGILSLKCSGFHLVFGYLKGHAQLSMVEVDFD